MRPKLSRGNGENLYNSESLVVCGAHSCGPFSTTLHFLLITVAGFILNCFYENHQTLTSVILKLLIPTLVIPFLF